MTGATGTKMQVNGLSAHRNCRLQKAAVLHSGHVTPAWPEEAFTNIEASISRFFCALSCLALVCLQVLLFSFSSFSLTGYTYFLTLSLLSLIPFSLYVTFTPTVCLLFYQFILRQLYFAEASLFHSSRLNS